MNQPASLPSDETGQRTAKKAAAMLVSRVSGYVTPTARQRQNLVVAFAKLGKVVYGKAFDIVKLSELIDLDDLEDVETKIHGITILEIKSTKKNLSEDFSGYFFALTAGEVLVAQSLKSQFRFVFVNTTTGHFIELTLSEIYARAKAIYPTWSISF